MSAETSDLVDVDVLIAGAGPVGMLGGILASRQGMSALVVERRDGPQRAPAAHVVNARTYEICRQAGLDMDRIFAAGKDPVDAGHVNFVTRLTGDLIGRLPFERQGEACLDVTPTPLRNLSQHRFEPILRDELEASSGAELRYGHRWDRSVPDDDGVNSAVTDLSTGEALQIRSRFVIGCDGAGSGVRQMLGIEMHGPPLIQCFLMIHFAADLRDVVAERPGVLHFVLDPAADGAFVAHDVDREWVFMHAFDPSTETVDDYTDARCLEVVRAAAGADIDAEVLGRGTWWMSAQTVESMGTGRIFLAGDSAHRFPPTGGLGLNSGMADIHNLMWRMAAIEDDWGHPSLLDSYADERVPVARNNAHQSLTNALKMVHLAEALGTDVEPTTERLLTSLADPDRAAAIADAVEMQAEHFDMLGLQLGYVYDKGALVPEGPPQAPPSPRVFVPSARPGARLPHAWLDEVGGRSTLDLVRLGRPVLFTFGDHGLWADALGCHPEPVAVVRIGEDVGELDEWRAICGVTSSGALLVRPDQHVAWRGESSADRSELAVGIAALSGHLGRDGFDPSSPSQASSIGRKAG